MAHDAWHFPRTDFAQRVFTALTSGPAQTLLLFAPRRTGKTEFLLQDLAPLAERKKHQVAYANFWQNPQTPLLVILQALDRALRGGSLAQRAGVFAARITPKFKIGGPGGEIEIDASRLETKGGDDHLHVLNDLIRRLANETKPAFLLFDEAQELARDKANAPLVAALRTALDTHKSGIATVFTGSSRLGLDAMFGDREAPFFRYATPIELPQLGDDFIDHLLGASEHALEKPPKRAALIAAFERLDRSPYFIRAALERMALNPSLPLARALADVEQKAADQAGFVVEWTRMKPLHRAVARTLASGEHKPFSADARALLGEALDDKAPTPAQVQTALRTLRSRGVVDRSAGGWALSDPLFARWILSSNSPD